MLQRLPRLFHFLAAGLVLCKNHPGDNDFEGMKFSRSVVIKNQYNTFNYVYEGQEEKNSKNIIIDYGVTKQCCA